MLIYLRIIIIVIMFVIIIIRNKLHACTCTFDVIKVCIASLLIVKIQGGRKVTIQLTISIAIPWRENTINMREFN